MPTIDGPLEIVVRLHAATGDVATTFESPDGSSLTPGYLCWAIDGSHYVVYQPEDFYDERLKRRWDSGNLVSPRDPHVRLVHVAAVKGPGPCPPGWTELARSAVGRASPG